MEVVSLFSGCGGIDLGFEKAGCQVIWANDISPNACETYSHNFGFNPIFGDIRRVKEFPKCDALVGCYPCQGFSVYGNRNPDDPRNYLYKEFVRALHQTKPKYFVAENVKGLLFGYGLNIFKEMLRRYKREGYDVYPKLINVKEYGIPQDRERVFIVGVRKDQNSAFSFPNPICGEGLKPYRTLKDALEDMPRPRLGEIYDLGYSSHYLSRNRKRGWDEVSFTIQACGRHVPLHPSGGKMVYVSKDKFRLGKAPNRRLSYKECAAIQSFPRKFDFFGSLSSKYKQIGNAVPPKIAEQIANSLMDL